MLVNDYALLDDDTLSKYKSVVKSRVFKYYILVRYIIYEVLWLALVLPRAIRSAWYYYFQHRFSNTKLHKDIRYSTKRTRNTFDIYEPIRRADGNPCIIFIHGGSWQFGDKIQYVLLGKKLSSHGVITVIANYTLYPKGKLNEQLEDVESLTNYVHDHIGSYGGRQDDIHLMGHSAGSHIIAQYVLTKKDSDKAHIRSLIGMGGVYDINMHFVHEATRGLEHLSAMRPNCYGPAGFKQSSPTHVISNRRQEQPLPHIYLMHGVADLTVPSTSSNIFYKMLTMNNVDKQRLALLLYESTGHIDLVYKIMDDDVCYDHKLTGLETGPCTRYPSSILHDVLQLIRRGDQQQS
ncbi:hypothetical protein SAMD00019534_007850, partial [Acytostelium subglobosum LB1]|uniref:hypothetical protein n=1 Tax=Acytostelium subglobosum LB1 TaxID=1410327 RepID=UPI0006449777